MSRCAVLSAFLAWLLAGCIDANIVETPALLVQTILADERELRFCAQRQFHITDLGAFLSSEVVDLNGDKKLEFVVRTKVHSNCLCGNRTCAGWIYRATAEGYEAIWRYWPSARNGRAARASAISCRRLRYGARAPAGL